MELLHKPALSARAQRGGRGRACAAAKGTELRSRPGTECPFRVCGLGRAAPGAQRGAVAGGLWGREACPSRNRGLPVAWGGS